ncbi:glycosyltransferase family A protein [Shewanella xiamenensis]
MKNPKFSVVIPLYNKEDQILSSVQSVLQQTFVDFEVLVVNDGSTDCSIQKLGCITDARVTIIHKSNGGVSSARNVGIQNSNGKFIAFLDADDQYEPDFLLNVSKLFNRFPQADAVTTAYLKCRGNKIKSCYIPGEIPKDGGVIKDFFKLWALDSFFCASSIVVNKDYFYQKNKWFPEGESMGEDQEMWFHIARHGTLVYYPKCLSKYNIGVMNSLTKTNNISDELPFINRLKKSVIDNDSTPSMEFFIRKYDIERAIKLALNGKKKEAYKLFLHEGLSFEFIKLKCILTVLIIMPVSFTSFIRGVRRRTI